MIETKYKICTKCDSEFEATTENFVIAKNGKYGLSSVCKSCQKVWRDNRKSHKKEYDKEYNEINREKRVEYSRKRYEENSVAMLEYSKNRYKCPEYVQKRKSYRETRKERDKYLFEKWRLNNSKRISTNKQRRYNKQKDLLATLTHDEWLDCVEYFNNSCAYCGLETNELAREHFVPVSKNGTFTKDNILPSCKSCNSSKNTKNFDDWYPQHSSYSVEREQKIIEYLSNLKSVHYV